MSLSKLRALDDFAEDRRNHPGPAAEPIPAPIAPGNSAPQRFGEPPGATGTVADVMRPAATVADTDHAAAAAYLMRHARAGALLVLDTRHTGRPVGIITEADIARAVADGKDVNEVRVHQLMTVRPAVIAARVARPTVILAAGHTLCRKAFAIGAEASAPMPPPSTSTAKARLPR